MTKTKYGHLVLTGFSPPKLEDGAIISKYHILAHASGIEKFNGKNFSIAATAIGGRAERTNKNLMKYLLIVQEAGLSSWYMYRGPVWRQIKSFFSEK